MDKLNICFDGNVLHNGLTNNNSRSGVYFVAQNVIQRLAQRDVNLYLYFDKKCKTNYKIIRELSLNIPESNILYPDSDFSHINSFLSPKYAIPEFISNFPNVSKYTILHDMIPYLFPEYFVKDEIRWLFDLVECLNTSEYYFSVSECTKKDYLKYFSDKLNKDNIDVIPLSTNLEYMRNNDIEQLNKAKEKYNIPTDKKYLFSLCSLEPRKNIIRTVRTFIEFISKNGINDLVYVLGGDAWDGFIEKLEKEISDYKKYEDKIIRAGYVDDEDLEILYSNAEWFIYTSEYEGFGMPPLEAMKCGCPVIVSNNSSLPEVVGDSAVTIDFDSEEQHIAAYEKYYYNETLRKEMAQKGIERAKLFSWDKCIDVILNRMFEVETKKKNKPLVTIITATYNLIENGRKKYFIQNLESVKNQTYPNIEHIIIDGASTDGTIELLEKYQNQGWIKYYSESDKGIYDAINKGILKANGKYVVCLNSDDFYCSNKAVEYEVMKLEENDADACYGNTLRVRPRNLSVMSEWRGKENFYPLFGAAPCHQSFMIKTDVIKELELYNLNYKVSADNNFITKMVNKNKKFVGINVDIINFRDGGFSNGNLELSKEDRIDGFWKEYGQYHKLTKLDSEYLFGHKFLQLSINQAIKLGCKIDNPDWQKEYFKILFRCYCPNIQEKHMLPFVKKIKLFGFLTIFKFKQDFKNKKWYFLDIPVFRIKQCRENKRKYYLFSIPVLKIVEKY